MTEPLPGRDIVKVSKSSEPVQSVALTSTFRLIQPRKGHRYSVDDMLVAYVAANQVLVHARSPRKVLDLGTGLGSVLLMLAWRFDNAILVGVEAQKEHVNWARQSVKLNGCDNRVTIVHGDLRDDALMEQFCSGFDLVTATPPYFNPQKSTICSNQRRAYAQWELRGGIEQYVRAASRAMSPGALFITCAAASPLQRTPQALAANGLHALWKQQVLPGENREPFLTLWVAQKTIPHMSNTTTDQADFEHLQHVFPTVTAPVLVLRHQNGLRTAEHVAIRQWFGVPCSVK